MKTQLAELLSQALARLQAEGLLPAGAAPAEPALERTRDRAHGDYASNVALACAKAASGMSIADLSSVPMSSALWVTPGRTLRA